MKMMSTPASSPVPINGACTKVEPRQEHIAVLGAGKMGAGIAQCFAMQGYPVTVIYVYDDKERGNGISTIENNLTILSRNGVVEAGDIPAILARIQFVDNIEDVDKADIVFECIVEDVQIKQRYFEKLDAHFPPETVLASNTSAISITQIGEKTRHRARVLGTHFWDPPYIIPLVEVIKTVYVQQDAVNRTFRLLQKAGKRPVVVEKDVPGFLANRMQHALFREALSIIEQGIATPQAVDDSIKYGFGMRLGISAPVEVMDRGGLDLTYNIHQYLFPYLEDSHQPLPILTERVSSGNLGCKTGHGLLEWDEEKTAQANENLLTGLIKVAKALDRL